MKLIIKFSYNLKKIHKLKFITIIIIILILYKIKIFCFNKILKKINSSNSNKWLVVTVFNPPNFSFLEFLKSLDSWKVIIIGNNKKYEKEWKTLNNETNLIYLSFKKQNKLKYKIIKYLNYNSYYRKNIGYLYAIQNGTKEIYEIDENIIISHSNDLNIAYNNTMICYGIRNDSKMINPYDFFNEKSIWPRGFRIDDIGDNENNKYYVLNSSKLSIKPLIFQGLINGIPDVDSLFFQTRVDKNNIINFKISNKYPLLYIPGNYIPINSKNTKYLYEIFPFLMLPTTLNERICDIFRGYIMQLFSWIYNGAIIYHSSKIYQKTFQNFKNPQFIEEKNLFYKLDNFLDELNILLFSERKNNSPTELLLELINNLVFKGFLGSNDLKIYKLFIQDLSNIGYIFPSILSDKNNFNNIHFFQLYSKFKLYMPYNPKIYIKNNRYKIINHYISHKIFSDILLIINYNHYGFHKLNKYLLKLYRKFFPKVIFISPNNIKEKYVISCNESFNGYFSYICFKKVYEKYPNFKGYLFTNDDDYIKIWEISNLDFNIPWFYIFHPIKPKWGHARRCFSIHTILNKNIEYKNNLINFLGFYDIPVTISDFYYIPNYIAIKIGKIFQEMYNHKVFLECAVPTTMAILNSSKYQLIYFIGLWGKERKEAINYLKKAFEQITVHPIKFSNLINQKETLIYNFFINGIEY